MTNNNPAFWISSSRDRNVWSSRASFNVIPVRRWGTLAAFITQNGGRVTGLDMDPRAEYAITVLDSDYFRKNMYDNERLPTNCYSDAFVYDYVTAKRIGARLPDLNKYNLTGSTNPKVDANQVFNRQKQWSELIQTREPYQLTKVTAQEVTSLHVLTPPKEQKERQNWFCQTLSWICNKLFGDEE